MKRYMKAYSSKDYFDRVAPFWDEMTKHDPERIEFLLDAINIKCGSLVLDVGTGTGILLPFLFEKVGPEGGIVALDKSSVMLNIARKKHTFDNLTFLHEDIENDFKIKDAFDCVVFYSVFPHIKNKEKALENVYTLLKTEGRIIICHSESRSSINEMHKGIPELAGDFLPTVENIDKMMCECNFKIIQSVDNSRMFLIIGEK
jgi:ubiquinone/menaquinone biosynthesis C-methylase UbiE